MAIFTAAEISEQKTAWKAALVAVSAGKSYTIAGRSVTRSDTREIRETLEWLDSLETELTVERSGPRIVVGRPYRQ